MTWFIHTFLRYYFFDGLAILFTILQMVYLAKKQKIGFTYGIIGSLCWSIFGLLAHSYLSAAANLLFAFLNVRGLWKWEKL
jgi:hypothetical protein